MVKASTFHELLCRAIAGDRQAKDEILQLYMPMIDQYSVVDGKFDEDLKQHLLLQVSNSIQKFRI